MKISYVTSFYNGECDGRFGRFHDWVHALRDMDDPPFTFDVHAVMAANPDGTLGSVPPGYLGDASDLWATKRNGVETVLNANRIYRDLTASDPDIIHLISFEAFLLPSVLSACRTLGVPLVLGPGIAGWTPIRESEFWFSGPISEAKLKLKYRLRKILVGRTPYERIVAHSKCHLKILDSLGVSQDDVTFLNVGVCSLFSPEGKSKTTSDLPELLYVGDFSEHKGYQLFLRALARIDRDVHSRIIGAGDPDQELIRSFGIEDRVTIEGFVDRADLPEYYRSADLFVLPTIDDNGPNTQIEALACGTPLVATDVLGLNEFASDDAAMYFWPRSPEALASTIDDALENLESMTKAAIEYAPEFNVTNTVEHLDSIYRTEV
jgi:glycosyltransferase involved in cell wall biosynthesis